MLTQHGVCLQHSSLTSERHSTEAVVAELAAKTAALRTWLERNEPKAAAWDPSMQPASSMFVPADELSRQALSTQVRCSAAYRACLGCVALQCSVCFCS